MSPVPDPNTPPGLPRPDPANPLRNPRTCPGHMSEEVAPVQPNELPPDPDSVPTPHADPEADHPLGPHEILYRA